MNMFQGQFSQTQSQKYETFRKDLKTLWQVMLVF